MHTDGAHSREYNFKMKLHFLVSLYSTHYQNIRLDRWNICHLLMPTLNDPVVFYWVLFMPLGGEGNGTPLQYSCLENPMDGGPWWAAVHGVIKSRTRLSDFTFTLHFHTLKKEMATHSSVLAWRIPGTEEPGGLPSMGSHRVGQDWCDLAAAAAYPWEQPPGYLDQCPRHLPAPFSNTSQPKIGSG